MLRSWLKKANETPPPSLDLPDPRSANNQNDSQIIVAANSEINSTPSPLLNENGECTTHTTAPSVQRWQGMLLIMVWL